MPSPGRTATWNSRLTRTSRALSLSMRSTTYAVTASQSTRRRRDLYRQAGRGRGVDRLLHRQRREIRPAVGLEHSAVAQPLDEMGERRMTAVAGETPTHVRVGMLAFGLSQRLDEEAAVLREPQRAGVALDPELAKRVARVLRRRFV